MSLLPGRDLPIILPPLPGLIVASLPILSTRLIGMNSFRFAINDIEMERRILLWWVGMMPTIIQIMNRRQSKYGELWMESFLNQGWSQEEEVEERVKGEGEDNDEREMFIAFAFALWRGWCVYCSLFSFVDQSNIALVFVCYFISYTSEKNSSFQHLLWNYNLLGWCVSLKICCSSGAPSSAPSLSLPSTIQMTPWPSGISLMMWH